MIAKTIPQSVKTSALESVAEFNRQEFGDWEIAYEATFRGRYVYLNRKAFSFRSTKICRLKYTGMPIPWEFEIYKYSTECYSPDECFFPGEDEVDGTLEGAMRAGMLAYPV